MLQKQKKLTKKELQEDQLVSTYAKTLDFVNKFKVKLFIVGGAIVVVVVALFLYTNYMLQKNESANEAITKIIPIYEAGNYQLALEGRGGNVSGFRQIADEFSGTETGQVAVIYKANCLFNLGKYDQALEAFEDFSGKNEILKGAAKAGIAACYEAKKDYASAAKYFEDAAGLYENNPMNGDYLLNAGINYQKMNKNSEAQVVFEKIKNELKTSSAVEEANRYLAIMNSK